MKSSDWMPIGELARQFDLAPHVLRHWEAMGLLTPAARVSGRRRYTSDHTVRVLTIIRAKAAGMSLEQIREILAVSDPAGRQTLLQRHHAELERRMQEIAASKTLIEHIMRCTADDFTQCPDYRRMVASATELENLGKDGCVV
ncbi:MerR family transcriptional regulator [Nonomuraea jiangxiensis]|uniref:DNA-binding transcriptional regulator, MerR family n=1 Tax=Nonomuraea jiangxiensis TaxID=633440 RepID=A0A1G9IUN0_9ACTN|nr:MerR family transcriptional regulator [Nonomuraea jiangxiensis]SDL29008.1 DNA-binding transcriptional regulator, MerR family [Nonomuraea jiangxiensis]